MPSDTQVRGGYLEVDRVRDPDGALAIISKRVNGPPLHTIGLFKEFVKDGVSEKSSFFSHKQAAAIIRVLGIAVDRARELEDAAMREFNAKPNAAGGRR